MNLVDLLSSGISSVKNYLSNLDQHAQTFSPPQAGPGLSPNLPSNPMGDNPALGALMVDYALSKSQAPDWLKSLSRGFTQSTTEFDPTAFGAVAGPFKGVEGLIPRLTSKEIGPFYHGTTPEKAAQILKEGLKAGEQKVHTNLMNGVYLSRFPSGTGAYANNGARGGDFGRGAILKIDKLPLSKLIVDEDGPAVDFHALVSSINNSRSMGIPEINPLPEYDFLQEPLKMARQYLLDNYGVEHSLSFSPSQLDKLALRLGPKNAYEYLSRLDKGPETMRMYGIRDHNDMANMIRNRNFDLLQMMKMISGGGKDAAHLGSAVYDGVIDPSRISLLEGNFGTELIPDKVNPMKFGDQFYKSYPRANVEEDKLLDVVSDQIQKYMYDPEGLPWWLR